MGGGLVIGRANVDDNGVVCVSKQKITLIW